MADIPWWRWDEGKGLYPSLDGLDSRENKSLMDPRRKGGLSWVAERNSDTTEANCKVKAKAIKKGDSRLKEENGLTSEETRFSAWGKFSALVNVGTGNTSPKLITE